MYWNVNKEDGSLIPVAGGTLYADNPIGSIIPFGGTVAPSGFFLCQGQALSRTEYADLFKAIGTSFGTGDGSTTFNIPDLRGEFLRGAGTNSHSGEGSGGTVGTHQDATKQIALTPWTQQLYFETGAVPSNFDSTTDGPTYQYLQNEAGHTGPQLVTSTYTSRPTNTSVNYIIKAKHTAVPTDFMDKVEEAIEESYSTSEVKTNKTWIDGKPIYCRVFKGTNATPTTQNSRDAFNDDIVISGGVDTLITCNGSVACYRSGETNPYITQNFFSIMIDQDMGVYWGGRAFKSGTGLTQTFYSRVNTFAKIDYSTVYEYTKTTD